MTLGIGALMMLIGLVLMIWAMHSGEESNTFDIDPGAQHYNYIPVNLFSGAKLGGRFSVDGASIVDLYVFNDSNYNLYETGATAPFIAHASGNSGSFEVAIDSGGTYYIVLEHGSGFQSSRQTGSVTHSVAGTNVVTLSIGALVFIVGLLLAAYGVMLRRREATAAAKLSIRPSSEANHAREPSGPAEPARPESPAEKPPQGPL